MEHIGGLPMYVATRGLYRMSPLTIVVPKVIIKSVEKLFEAHRSMDQSELNHTFGLDVGEEFYLRKDIKVKAFWIYHCMPSQGYVVYNVKQKLKKEYEGLPGDEIKRLKLSGVEITSTATSPELAFTGDTMSDFIIDDNNADVLKAKILLMEPKTRYFLAWEYDGIMQNGSLNCMRFFIMKYQTIHAIFDADK